MITRESIDGYFRAREWRFIKRGENIWHTGYRGNIKNFRRDFEIFLHLDEDWIYLQVPLLREIRDDCKSSLYEFCLSLNYGCFFCKFCVHGNSLLLVSELPRTSTAEQLNDALWSLIEYSNRYFLELMTLATDKNIAAFWHNWTANSLLLQAPEENAPEIIFNSNN